MNSVLASSPGFTSRCARTSGQTSVNGSGRVRQVCSAFMLLGRRPDLRYLRAVFSSIPVLAAATASVFSRIDSGFLLPLRGRCLTYSATPFVFRGSRNGEEHQHGDQTGARGGSWTPISGGFKRREAQDFG